MTYDLTQVVEKCKLDQLDAVRLGMRVYDGIGDEIGEVTFIYLGTALPEESEWGQCSARTLPLAKACSNPSIEMLSHLFGAQEMSLDVLEYLRRHGFIRIKSNDLFAMDHFATTEQILSVKEDKVLLDVCFADIIIPG